VRKLSGLITEQEALAAFPAPTFRPYQKATIKKIVECLNTGVRCILLDAPTGSGKSYINTTFARVITPCFYATPQLSLIDQIKSDPLIGKYYVEIKGRQNYPCVKDTIFGSTVDVGLCRRYSDYPCSPREECLYWIQKWRAFRSDAVLCSFTYLILEGLVDKVPPGLGERELLILDESHNIAEHVVQQVSLEVSPYTLPEKIYSRIRIGEIRTSSEMVSFVESVKVMCEALLEDLQMTLEGGRISLVEARERNMLEEWLEKAKWFLETYADFEWIWSTSFVTYRGEPKKKLVLQPLYAKPFCPLLVWKRARIYIVSSATILDPDLFVEETGLDLILSKDEIKHIQVPSYFPPENRRIVDLADSVGSMRLEDQEINLTKAAAAITQIALFWERGKNVAVMCPSYDLAKRTYELLPPEVKKITILPSPEDREQKLEEWLSGRGRLFFAVAYEEGQDWREDLCEALVLLKTLYPDASDQRVARRLEKKEFRWYCLQAMKKTLQALGRIHRSERDVKNIYVLDAKFWALLRHWWVYVPEWFREVVPFERKPKYEQNRIILEQRRREKLGNRS
jgi:Rad3-related DNA helicase